MKTMTINGVAYIEATPVENERGEVCSGCALGADIKLCRTAVTGEAVKAFGDHCLERNVIYMAVPEKQE